MFRLIAISIALIISGLLLVPLGYKQYAIWDAGNPGDDKSFVNELLSPLTPNIPAVDVYQAIDSNYNFPVIDVRNEEEYDKVHLPGAVLIPEQELYQKFPELYPDKNKTVYVYSDTGHSGAVAARLLNVMGYKKAYNIEGGLVYWQKLQYRTGTNNPIYF